MAVEVASLTARLELDSKGLEDGLKKSRSALGSFANDFKSGLVAGLGIGAAELGAKAFQMIASGIGDSIAAAREAIAINKDLEQTIISTGGAAGVTADAARKLADELSRVTNFEDDAIVKGEAMLLTFTNIGSDVFPRATEAMLDMAQKFGSMDSASVQLGKALNDPLKGISALQRVGVTFSAQQKEQIQNFMAVNDIASAQGIILDELAREFGGQARAMADPIIQLGNAWGNLQESFGANVLLPVLNSLATVALPGVMDAIDNFKLSISSLTQEEIVSSQKTFTDLIGVLNGIGSGFNELGKGIVSVATGLGLADKNSTGLGLAIKALGVVLGALVQPLQLIGGVLNVVGAVLQSIGYIIDKVSLGWNKLTGATESTSRAVGGVRDSFSGISTAMATLSSWVDRVQLGWDRLMITMGQNPNLPPALTPGSPTPFEIGLHGIANAINSMPPLSRGFGGSVPMAVGGGGSSTINVNIGGVSASTTTNGDAPTEAIRMTLQLLRAQLGR